ncbi:MAG: hypothetical protein FWG92_01640 [Leptospirales bacterium]|nr:hypothetical protein [Leptospirales bacterium]
MKKTVFIALSLAVISFAVLPLSAEKKWKGNGGGEYGYGIMGGQSVKRLNMMQSKLGLTNNQVDRMFKIQKDYMDKIYQNRNNADKVKELKGQCRTEMESVLTSEQKTKWNNLAKDRKANGKDKKKERGAKKGGDKKGAIQNKLGLSDAQCDRIFKINKDYMDQFYQNRNNESRIKELRAKQIGEIQNVLTPEQRTKWDEMKKNRQKKGDKKK